MPGSRRELPRQTTEHRAPRLGAQIQPPTPRRSSVQYRQPTHGGQIPPPTPRRTGIQHRQPSPAASVAKPKTPQHRGQSRHDHRHVDPENRPPLPRLHQQPADQGPGRQRRPPTAATTPPLGSARPRSAPYLRAAPASPAASAPRTRLAPRVPPTQAPSPGASAQTTDAAPNPVEPATTTRRWPSRSPIAPQAHQRGQRHRGVGVDHPRQARSPGMQSRSDLRQRDVHDRHIQQHQKSAAQTQVSARLVGSFRLLRFFRMPRSWARDVSASVEVIRA